MEKGKKDMSIGELPRVGQQKNECKRDKPIQSVETKEITIQNISITMPALVGLREGYRTNELHARLSIRQAEALNVLVEGFDNKHFEVVGVRSASGQDWLRHVLDLAADELGL